ncbi:MAG: hypothetical protein ACAH10_01595 [Methylophilaceae bacterium]
MTKTLELSHQYHPNLTSAKVFKQAAVITIPDLKTLSIDLNPDQPDAGTTAPTATGLHLSYQLQYPVKGNATPQSAESLVPPAMKAEYERLVKRDRDLKLASQNQDEHIASLEKILGEVKPKVDAILAEGAEEVAAETVEPSPEPDIQTDLMAGDKPAPKASLLQQLRPFNNLLFGAGAVLVLLFLIWYSRRRRAQQFASLSGLNTFIYDTLLQPEVRDSDYVGEKSKVVDLTAREEKPASEVQPELEPIASVEASMTETADQTSVQPEQTLPDSPEEEAEAVISSASILMGAGHSKQAQVLLEAYLQMNPQQSVYPWLYLLDIHRSLNQKAEFQRLLSRLHDNFNVMLPQWEDKEVVIVVPESLEEYPHVMKQLQRIWQKSEAAAYLNTLLLDRREGERVGFSLQVLQEIAMLQKVLEIRDQFSIR